MEKSPNSQTATAGPMSRLHRWVCAKRGERFIPSTRERRIRGAYSVLLYMQIGYLSYNRACYYRKTVLYIHYMADAAPPPASDRDPWFAPLLAGQFPQPRLPTELTHVAPMPQPPSRHVDRPFVHWPNASQQRYLNVSWASWEGCLVYYTIPG